MLDNAVNLFFTPYREGLPLLLFLWLTEIGTGATGAAVVQLAPVLRRRRG